MAFKVVQLVGLAGAPDYDDMFRKAGVKVELVKKVLTQASEDDIINAVGDADAAIIAATFMPFPRRVLINLENCKFIMSIGIGYDRLDVEAATELGILVANVPDASLEEVSDHTMGLILACSRKIVQLNDIAKGGYWKSMREPCIQDEIWPKLSRLKGQVLGLIGFGRIARNLVPKANGFKLRIIAYDPYVASSIFKKFGVEQVSLNELLTRSDIVSIHVPLTKETTQLLRLEQFKVMKPSACLINTARGAVIDSDALYTALKQGYISAAAVDVTDPEPIPADSPLLELDNFIVTAHSAGMSPGARYELHRRPAEEVVRVAKGDWPVGLLDPRVKSKYRKKWGLTPG
ncbi:C-terminal binding protein [Chloroflexota bacterium]